MDNELSKEIKEELLGLKDYVVRSLHATHKQLLKQLREEREKFNPQAQFNMRKTLLALIPQEPMNLRTYMGIVAHVVGKHNVDLSLKEYEMLLHRLNLVVDNQVCAQYNPEVLKIALEVL